MTTEVAPADLLQVSIELSSHDQEIRLAKQFDLDYGCRPGIVRDAGGRLTMTAFVTSSEMSALTAAGFAVAVVRNYSEYVRDLQAGLDRGKRSQHGKHASEGLGKLVARPVRRGLR
jgi:hypothetical protein